MYCSSDASKWSHDKKSAGSIQISEGWLTHETQTVTLTQTVTRHTHTMLMRWELRLPHADSNNVTLYYSTHREAGSRQRQQATPRGKPQPVSGVRSTELTEHSLRRTGRFMILICARNGAIHVGPFQTNHWQTFPTNCLPLTEASLNRTLLPTPTLSQEAISYHHAPHTRSKTQTRRPTNDGSDSNFRCLNNNFILKRLRSSIE